MAQLWVHWPEQQRRSLTLQNHMEIAKLLLNTIWPCDEWLLLDHCSPPKQPPRLPTTGLVLILSMIDDDTADSLEDVTDRGSVFSESYVDSFYTAPIVTSIYSFEMNSEFLVMFYSSDITSI